MRRKLKPRNKRKGEGRELFIDTLLITTFFLLFNGTVGAGRGISKIKERFCHYPLVYYVIYHIRSLRKNIS